MNGKKRKPERIIFVENITFERKKNAKRNTFMRNIEEIKTELKKQEDLKTTLEEKLKEPTRCGVTHNTMCEAKAECKGVIKTLKWILNTNPS